LSVFARSFAVFTSFQKVNIVLCWAIRGLSSSSNNKHHDNRTGTLFILSEWLYQNIAF